jgi:hypothetical protein
MERVTLVMGSTGGVESLQHRGDVLRLNGGVGIVLNISLMRSGTMIQPSDNLHNVVASDRFEVVPDKNVVTVQGNLEKSLLEEKGQSRGLPSRSARSRRHSSQAQPYQGQSREPQSPGTFSH